MWDDPIVAETRQIREQLAAQFNYDIWALGEHFKAKRAKAATALIAQARGQGKPKRTTMGKRVKTTTAGASPDSVAP